MSAEGESTTAVLAALAANVGIAVAKFVAFLFTGSTSMLAESVHSVADSGNQGLLLLGGRRSRRRRTAEHPFGYGRERYFYAFMVALVLFSLGSLFALYEGWHKVREPHPVDSPGWAFGVLIAAIVMESLSFRTAIRAANETRAGASWLRYIRRAKAPEIAVVLLEDSAALVGLVLALGGVTLAVLTGDGVWDGVGTLCIGVLLGLVAAILAVETKSLLLGEGAVPSAVRRIEAALLGPGVDRGHPPAHHASGPRRAAGRGQDRRAVRGHRARHRLGDRRCRDAGPGSRAGGEGHLSRAGHRPQRLTRPAGTTLTWSW